MNGSDAIQPTDQPLTGKPSQIEWATRIRRQVGAEFDRAAAAFRSVAALQSIASRNDTEAIIAILAQKRVEVMAKFQRRLFHSSMAGIE